MYFYCHSIEAVRPDMPDELLVRINEASVTGLALIDAAILEWYDVPPIYEIRPTYHVEKRERWKDIFTVLSDGTGDCKDFVAWRLAELWKAGIDARAESIVQRQGNQLLFHTYIRHANGNKEDPSVALGMVS